MTGLQKKMLEMLCEIDEICQKHKIEYCLFAGTGLGADRHGGFIPWDDDADIIMTLDNYEKFLNVFDAEAKENRVLNCLEKDSSYPFTYARYVDTSTTAIQRHTAFGGCDPGVKIDIFVVVPTHSKLEKAEKHRLEILAFSEVICPYAIMHHYRPEGYAAVYEKEQQLYNRLGREKYIKKRLDKLKYYKKKGTSRYVLFSGMMCNSYFFDADTVEQTKYVTFENVRLLVSENNVDLSRELYGEGWISKPEKVDVPRHTFLLDMESPYDNYLNKLWDHMDYEETRNIVSTRRNMHLYEREKFKDVIVNNQNLKNLAVELDINERFKRVSEETKKDWRELYNMFSDYYSMQLKGINKHYQMFINLEDDVFEAAMNTAIMMDRYYEAADVMQIGIKSGKLLSGDDRVKKIINRINVCRNITETMYLEKNLDKVNSIISEIEDEWLKDSLTVRIASIWIKAIDGTAENTDVICGLVDSYAEAYGSPGELLIVKGYCLEKSGDEDAAAKVYSTAAENVRNGCAYQWLANKGFSTYEQQI